MTHRRTGLARAGLSAVVAGLLLAIFGFVSPASAAPNPGFQGECTPDAVDPMSGSCTPDKTNGASGSFGTVTYERTAENELVFDFSGLTADFTGDDPIQVCVRDATGVASNPYLDTSMGQGGAWQPCVGNQNGDRLFAGTVDGNDLVTVDLSGLVDLEDPIHFAVHINLDGETTYIIGGTPGDTPPPGPECPEGTGPWTDTNENGEIDEGECGEGPDPEAILAAAIECGVPTGMKVTVTNTGDADGTVDIESGDVVVHDDVVVPAGGSVDRIVDIAEDTDYVIEVVGVETFADTRDCEEVQGVVIPKTPETPAKPAVQVKGVQVQAQELPRTGDDELTLALLGLGLVLVGGGALLVSRDHAAA